MAFNQNSAVSSSLAVPCKDTWHSYEELMEHAGYIDEFPEGRNSTAAAGIIAFEDFSRKN